MWELDGEKKRAVDTLKFGLHPKQRFALNTKATEVLWGGAAGGGKSQLLRFASIIWAASIPNLQIYLFRRLYPDLVRTHIEGPQGYKQLLKEWVDKGYVQIVEGEVRFLFNGSKIYLCHCKDEADKYNYLSVDIHVLLVDELTTFPESVYRFLRSRVRATNIVIPERYKDYFPRILCASNPVGVGHTWVKKTWIDGKNESEVYQADEDEGGMTRQFIRATIKDNPTLMQVDPKYIVRLKGLGSKELVRAYLEGSWDTVIGAYFPEFTLAHQIEPFTLKSHWTRFRAFDWGYSAPFCVLWLTVVSEPVVAKNILQEDITIPSGAIIVYREWLGENEQGAGLRLTPQEIARGIQDREQDQETTYGVADSAIFVQDGGPSIAEKFMQSNIFFFKADKRRVPGWTELRSRLTGSEGTPMLFMFKTCTKLIRDLPSLQHSEKDPEDCESEGVCDHGADALRYALMSRPYISKAQENIGDFWNKKITGPLYPTLDELWAEHKKERTGHDFFRGLNR